MRDRRRKEEERRRSIQLQTLKFPNLGDPGPLIAVIEECIAISQIKGASFLKLVQFLRQNEYKSIQLLGLREETAFIMLKALDRWVVEIFTMSRHEDLPSYTVILSEFYRFAARAFRVRKSERMTTAYAYFLNNMALVSLRFKQYTKSLEYFQEIVELYNVERIPQCIFSIAFANLAGLYKQLKEQERSQMYIIQATSLTKDIYDQSIRDNCSFNTIQEVGSLLATQCTLMSQILKPTDPRFKEPFAKLVDLVKKGHLKPSQRKSWSVKNLVDKLSKGEYIRYQYQDIFKINLEELKFYSQVGRNQTTETHIRSPSISLPPINTRMLSPFRTIQDNLNYDNMENISKYSKFTLHKQHLTSSRHKSKLVSLYHPERQSINSSRYQDEIKQQYTSISQQNKELKSALQTLIQKQTDTQKILEKFILPKIVEIVTAPSPISFPSIALSDPPKNQNTVVFKNLRANIEFSYEGIIITSFGNSGEKIPWSALKYIMNKLNYLDLFMPELQISSSQYHTAKMLFRYITIDRHIKVKRYPTPDYSLKLFPNTTLQFYHVRDTQFKIAYVVDDNLQFIIFCDLCKKSFDKYFKIHKTDDFEEDLWDRFSGVSVKKKEYFVEVIKYREEEDLQTPLSILAMNMENVLAPLKQKLKETDSERMFVKLILQCDQFQSSRLYASLFIITADDNEQKLQMKFHNLGCHDSPTPQQLGALIRQHPYWLVLQNYGVNYKKLTLPQRQLIKNLLCDFYSLKSQRIKFNPIKSKSIMYLDVAHIEISSFKQILLDQKYFRPARAAVVGVRKKKHGFRFGLYNQYSNSEDSFFVICPENDKHKQQPGSKKEVQPTAERLSKILKRIDLKDIFQKYKAKKPEQREQIYHVEAFLELYMWA